MTRQELDARCQERIAELDRLLALLHTDLRGLWASQPPAADARDERLRAADRLAADLRADLATAAAAVRRDLPVWSDRAGLEATLTDLLAVWADLDASRPRRRLLLLAQQVENGRLHHKLSTKTARLETIRMRVPDELRQAGARPAPPDLSGPDRIEDDWLTWAWGLDGAELALAR